MNKTTALIIFGAISLIPIALAVILMENISKFPDRWLGLSHRVFTALFVLLAAWMIFNSYLKLVEALGKKQLEKEKADNEIKLAEIHNRYRMEQLKAEIRKKELDLEQ